MKTHPLHEKAKSLVREYIRLESELISLLQSIEKEKVFLGLGYASMFQYAVSGLELTESQAYMFIGVSRKCAQIPELQNAIHDGELKASQAKQIVSVITSENSSLWIEKAKALNQKTLQREVAHFVSPQGKVAFKSEISRELEKKLERCREILNQNSAKFSSWEDVLDALSEQYLKSKDPVSKAERNKDKQLVSKRVTKSRPAQVTHAVNRRDRGKCQFVLPSGKKCETGFWTDIHHIVPRSEGGKDQITNLTTLCRSHHERMHDFEGTLWARRAS